MQEIVKLVSEKVGISNDQARVAVEVVINFLKDKLPEPLAGQLDGLLSGGGNPQDLLKNIGGLFGQK